MLWGLFFGVLLLVEKFVFPKGGQGMPRLLGHVYVLFAVLLSFVLFNADGLSGAAQDIAGLFGGLGLRLSSPETVYALRSRAVLLVVAAIGATPWPARLVRRFADTRTGGRVMQVAGPVLLLLLLLLVTAYLVDGSFKPVPVFPVLRR